MKEHILDPDYEEEGSKSAVHKELQELLDVIEESESEHKDSQLNRAATPKPARPKVVGRFVALKLSWSGGSQSSSQASNVSSTTNTFLGDDDLAKFLENVISNRRTQDKDRPTTSQRKEWGAVPLLVSSPTCSARTSIMTRLKKLSTYSTGTCIPRR